MKRAAPEPHCTVGLEHWSRFTDRDFPPDECQRCEEHLKTCAECRAKVRAVRDTIGLCRRVAHRALPPAVKAGAMKRVKTLLATVKPQKARGMRRSER